MFEIIANQNVLHMSDKIILSLIIFIPIKYLDIFEALRHIGTLDGKSSLFKQKIWVFKKKVHETSDFIIMFFFHKITLILTNKNII